MPPLGTQRGRTRFKLRKSLVLIFEPWKESWDTFVKIWRLQDTDFEVFGELFLTTSGAHLRGPWALKSSILLDLGCKIKKS